MSIESQQGSAVMEQQPFHTEGIEHLPEHADEITLLDLLIVFAERKWLVLKVALATAILATLISLVLPVRYTAEVSLLPPQKQSSMSSMLTSQLGGLAAMAGGGASSLLKNPNDLYVGMFKSHTVEDAMIARYGLMQEYHEKYMSDARRKFESYVKVDGNGKDGLIHISVEDRTPQRAAELANGYVEQFRKLSAHLAITEAGQRRLFFEQQLQQSRDNLSKAEDALKATEQKTGMIEFSGQARALIQEAASLRANITAMEVQIQALKTYASDENSQLVQAQQELATLRGQLAKLGGSEDNPNDLIMPKGQVTQASLEYARKLRDVQYYQTIFEVLAKQYEAAKLDEAREGALIQVVDPAIPPDRKSFPKRGLIVIVSTLVGLFLGLFLALAQAAMERMNQDEMTATKLQMLRKAWNHKPKKA